MRKTNKEIIQEGFNRIKENLDTYFRCVDETNALTEKHKKRLETIDNLLKSGLKEDEKNEIARKALPGQNKLLDEIIQQQETLIDALNTNIDIADEIRLALLREKVSVQGRRKGQLDDLPRAGVAIDQIATWKEAIENADRVLREKLSVRMENESQLLYDKLAAETTPGDEARDVLLKNAVAAFVKGLDSRLAVFQTKGAIVIMGRVTMFHAHSEQEIELRQELFDRIPDRSVPSVSDQAVDLPMIDEYANSIESRLEQLDGIAAAYEG